MGNLVSRVAKLIETKMDGELIFNPKFQDRSVITKIEETQKKYHESITQFKLHEALTYVWQLFDFANGYLDEKKPWAQIDPEHLLNTLTNVADIIRSGTKLIEPFLPETAAKIYQRFGFTTNTTMLEGYTIRVIKSESLFPRLK